MRSARIMVIRSVLALCFAYLLCVIFFKEVSLFRVLGLAVAMTGFAYLFEHTRKKDKKE